MALIPCPDCQKEVSSQAVACPQCALPYPGRQEQENGHLAGALRTCPDCKKVISKKAQTCPSCGSPVSIEEESQESVATPSAEETWLCPHCSKPYTRRAKGRSLLDELGSISPKQEKALPRQSGKGLAHEDASIRADGQMVDPSLMSGVRRKKKSPLWGEARESYQEVPRYPRSKKKWTAILLVMIMIVLSVSAWAIWEFRDINGLEALVYWNM